MAFRVINKINGRIYFVNKAGLAGRRGRHGSRPKLWYFTLRPTDNTLSDKSDFPYYLTIRLSKRNTFYVVRKDKPDKPLPELIRLKREVILAQAELDRQEERKQYVPDNFPWEKLSQLKLPSSQLRV